MKSNNIFLKFVRFKVNNGSLRVNLAASSNASTC
ncbi:hypothetical protein C5167_022339 [Papaver somniferum]|uniref:Uncharacterized protein n=1 Tax=Papaver somniferum TaxID=3469 RepID=A0A4Y7JKS7_PAPSO|nr:hypothetical protein C5167_022339 [Papaver somniferum]